MDEKTGEEEMIRKSARWFIAALVILGMIISAVEAFAAKEKPEIFVQTGHASSVSSVAFSPDGKYALSGSRDNTLKLWDVETGKEIRHFKGHTSWVNSAVFSRDGKHIVSTASSIGENSQIKLWDVAAGKEIRAFAGQIGDLHSAAFSSDGRYVMYSSGDRKTGIVKLWDVATGKETRAITIRYPEGTVYSIFSPDGSYVLSGDGSGWGFIELWNVATGEKIREFVDSKSDKPLSFSPDGKYIFSVKYPDTVNVWDVSTGKIIRTFLRKNTSDIEPKLSAFSPNGKYALSGSRDNTLKLWDVYTGNEIRSFTGHENWITSVAFSPNGKYALSGSRDNTLKLWDVSTGREIRSFGGDIFNVTSVILSSDGQYVLSADSGRISLWDVSTGRRIQSFLAHKEDISALALSPDGKYVLSGAGAYTSARVGDEGRDFALKLWDISTGREIKTFSGHTKYIKSVAFSPDGRYTLSSGGDDTLRLWEVSTERQIQIIKESKENYLGRAIFSHDGSQILAGYCKFDPKLIGVCSTETVKAFDAFTLREIKTFSPINNGAYNAVLYIALSQDGKYIINGLLRLWEVNTGKLVRQFSEGYRTGVAFSPDSRFVLSSSSDLGNIELFNVATGGKIRSFTGHTRPSFSLAVSSDAR
ncbi:MAG TPA: WD40 repeat domain-containing protein, partial [Smithellaceae bacterium]|nr:WD40 repeat domain-containing protein [Smithellaceae bacterium]